jgi:hypothetical protein
MEKEVASLDAAWRADFNQAACTARVVARLAVSEAALVEMQQRNRWRRAQDSST